MFGRKAVAHHLRAKYRSMRNVGEASRPIARLGVVDLPKASDQPCVMVEQSGKPGPSVLDVTERELISTITISTVAPHPSEARPVLDVG